MTKNLSLRVSFQRWICGCILLLYSAFHETGRTCRKESWLYFPDSFGGVSPWYRSGEHLFLISLNILKWNIRSILLRIWHLHIGALKLLVCHTGSEAVLSWMWATGGLLTAECMSCLSECTYWSEGASQLTVAALCDHSALAKGCRVPSDHSQMSPVLLGCLKWFRSFLWLSLQTTSGSLVTAAVVTWRRLPKGLPLREERKRPGDQSKTTMKQTTPLEASPVMSWRMTGSGTVASCAGAACISDY